MTGHPTRIRAGALALLAGSTLVASFAGAKPTATSSPAAPANGADQPERVIEKKDGDYVLRMTIRPGSLKTNRVADMSVELFKNLDIPDPVTGNQMPLSDSHPIATVKAPEPASHAKHAESETTRYMLWPNNDSPGAFSFHFTPTDDGIYEITVAGSDASAGADDSAGPHPFQATFRIGAGLAAAQTEKSQTGTALRRTVRRPIGGQGDLNEKRKKLGHLMSEIGFRYVNLDSLLSRAPSKAGQADAAAEAKALSTLFAQVKGLVPGGGDAHEFDTLASATAASFDGLAAAGAKTTHKTLAGIESTGCNECHAKYRFEITADLSQWPKFPQRGANE